MLSAAGAAKGLLVTGGAEGVIRVWDWGAGQAVAVLSGEVAEPSAASLKRAGISQPVVFRVAFAG